MILRVFGENEKFLFENFLIKDWKIDENCYCNLEAFYNIEFSINFYCNLGAFLIKNGK
jgi:hypothetical protein